MAEEVPSDVVPRQPKTDRFKTSCVQQAGITVSPDSKFLENIFSPCVRHDDPTTPNTCDEIKDHHPYPSAVTDDTSRSENLSDVSGYDAGMSSSDGDDSNMRDIRHPPRALYENPLCEQENLDPDMAYSQHAVSPNPIYPQIPSRNLEELQNDCNPNQIYELDVCTEPAHRPADSVGNPSIELSTAQDCHDNTESTTSGAAEENIEINDVEHDVAGEATAVPSVRPNPTSGPANSEVYIQPYAVRYQEQGGNKALANLKCGGTPYAVRYQEDNEDDVDITSHAVTYSRQYDMPGVKRRDTAMTDTDTSDSVNNDINAQRIRQHWRALHHQDPSSIPNAMYVPRAPQQAAHADPNRRFYSKHGPSTDANLRYKKGVYGFQRNDFYHNEVDVSCNDLYSKDVYSNDFYSNKLLNDCCKNVVCHNDFYIKVKDVHLPNDNSLRHDPI
uniref:Uncharacterized protein n=1 Tax=Branchiostoma floridae TaxID=7739 RepID=C3YZL1_BRAFL|eukprot:XP_002598270.1 hypothetical protein BRAFLDRAFT_69625 [Branchiostoma floridae]